MSSTNRGAKRREGDDYQTPQALADFLVQALIRDDLLIEDDGEEILEPHAGDGAFIKAVSKFSKPGRLYGNEISLTPERERIYQEAGAQYGSERFEEWGAPQDAVDCWDTIIGNPPYADAERQIRKALSLLKPKGVLAFLLRLAFLETAGRFAFWQEHKLLKVFVLAERPSFTGGQTDSSAYGFFVWGPGLMEKDSVTELEIVSWKPTTKAKLIGKPDLQIELPDWPREAE